MNGYELKKDKQLYKSDFKCSQRNTGLEEYVHVTPTATVLKN